MAPTSARVLRRLNPDCAQALSAAASMCQSRAHAQITVEHWLLKLLEQGEGDLTLIARRYEWDMDALWRGLLDHLDRLPRSVQSKPQLSPGLENLIKQAWLRASMDDNESVRSAHLLGALIQTPHLLACEAAWPLLSLSDAQLDRLFALLDQHSEERPQVQHAAALEQTGVSANPLSMPSPSSATNEALLAVLDKFT